MLTREQLNTYLEAYDQSISLRRFLNLNSWVTQLRDFVKKLDDDVSIDAVKLTELQGIVKKCKPDTVNFRGELSAGAALAKKINDALHADAEEVLAEPVIMMIFDGLRPEQRAQLMTLNKRYHALLRDPSFWKSAVQKHFKWSFDEKKSLLGVNWLQVFGASHRDEYRHLNQRGKKIFSSIKSGDLTELILLNFKSSDLNLLDRQSIPLLDYLSSDQPQVLLDYIYRLINQDKKDMNVLMLNHWAAICNQAEAVLLDVNLADNSGRTPLHVAAYSGHLAVVEALIAAGANVNAVRNDGVIPLFYAAQNGHLAVVEVLIMAGANINVARNSGAISLHAAAQNGHLAVAEALIAAGANVNAVRNDGVTPLYIAAQNGHLAVVEVLIAANANVNAACNDGETPLFVAAQNGHLAVVDALISANADVNAARNTRTTPLFVAAYNGNLPVVEALIAADANVNAASNPRTTALYVAAQGGHLAVVEVLIAADADVNAACAHGGTPIYVAAQGGHLAVVEVLIAAGSDVNAACINGSIPLYFAVRKGYSMTVKALIEAGANVNAVCAGGETLLDVAKREKHYDIVKLLSQKKLDLYIKEKAESNEPSQNTMTLFGKTISYGYSKEQTLSAAIALKAVAQGADKSILEEHRDALNQGDLKPFYENLTRKR